MWVKFKFVFGSGLEGFSLGAPVFFFPAENQHFQIPIQPG